MGRLFEQGSDVDPILTHKVAMGLAGNTTKNSTWSKIVAWLLTQFKLETEQYIVNMGAWDMDASGSIAVAHGLADYTKILSVNWVIYDDAGTLLHTSENYSFGAGTVYAGITSITATVVNIQRTPSGGYDSTQYNDAVMNRGKLIILSEPQ